MAFHPFCKQVSVTGKGLWLYSDGKYSPLADFSPLVVLYTGIKNQLQSSLGSSLICSDVAKHQGGQDCQCTRDPWWRLPQENVQSVEISQLAKYPCSFCGPTNMKRRAMGVWHWLLRGNSGQWCLDLQHCFCHHSKVCHQKTEGIERPAETTIWNTASF